MRNKILGVIFGATLIAAPAFAQQAGGAGSSDQQGNIPQQGQTGETGQTGVSGQQNQGMQQQPSNVEGQGRQGVSGRETVEQPAKLGSADRKFIEKAGAGGLFEVKLAQLALDKGQSQAVKTIAQRMIDDHTKVNDQLRQIVDKVNFSMPTNITSEQQKIYDKLSKLSGKQFDEQYLKTLLNEHQKDIKDFEHAKSAVKDPDLKQFAENTLPALREHEQMIRQEYKNLK